MLNLIHYFGQNADFKLTALESASVNISPHPLGEHQRPLSFGISVDNEIIHFTDTYFDFVTGKPFAFHWRDIAPLKETCQEKIHETILFTFNFQRENVAHMQVTLSLTRKTQYSKIVEMEESKFKKLESALDGVDRGARREAEKELNRMVTEKDWQDDDLDSVDEFEEFKEEK